MQYLGLDYLFISHQRLFWVYVLTAFVIAFIYMLGNKKSFLEYKNRKIWTHKSSILDYKYFVVIAFIKVVFILPFILSSKDVSLWTILFLQEQFGFMQALELNREYVVILYTLALFIIGDFSRYILHRLMHILPFLWKIHQVHHSAEVLNPLTFYRVHPIENILFGVRYSLVVGVITGAFIYLFGANIGLLEIVGANIFVFASGVLGANLRHSHIPLRYGDFLEKIFISPYQHQLHHSVEFTHKNFGGTLALWDFMFKTLHIEKTRVEIEYGLKEKNSFNSISQILFTPFIKGIKI